MLVSIVVPVYNSSAYLKRCLDSLLNQTFKKDYEILLVDNGSTDNSTKIIDEYVKKHRQIRRLDCAERGAGAARNFGANHAKGKYLWFVDADDYIAETAVETLFETAEKDRSDFCMLDIEYRNSARKKHLKALDPSDKDALKKLVRYGFRECGQRRVGNSRGKQGFHLSVPACLVIE